LAGILAFGSDKPLIFLLCHAGSTLQSATLRKAARRHRMNTYYILYDIVNQLTNSAQTVGSD